MSEIKEILEAQHKYFYTGETKKLAFRIAMLKRLEEAVIRHEKELLLALIWRKHPLKAMRQRLELCEGN